MKKQSVTSTLDPFWYKDAIIYELRVRSFFDSDNDGIGDFCGLTERLDYLEDLGVTTIWLLPFYPSPLRDDGYDISDYTGIHPEVGTMNDFKSFLREAHRRGLQVVTELVLNHTSDQHPWFQRARHAPAGSRYRDFFVWSDSAERYNDARIIFKDFEPSNWSWDPVAKAYYWHRFYSHQPDLNFENPAVRRAMFQVVDFWLGLGVDGLRLDAVPYLYEREGTSCENLEETHRFLRELRRHVDRKYPNRMLLAEANQWPEDAVAYFADGNECHMAFHFPIMPRMFLGLRMEDRFPLTDILAQTPEIPESCQWALFLRNHDELTLEMVTDEERDFMFRAYAHESRMRINLGIRRRLAPLLGRNRRSIELMNGLLFALPGTPVIYYGDELGMGDNIYLGDRNGVRTPMQWNGNRNAGFSGANSQQLFLPPVVDHEFHYEAVNVETQQNNLSSLLWWMKRLIALRKQYKAFGRGSVQLLAPDNPRIFAFIRSYADERLLVVANLSRFVQYVELDLSAYEGQTPVELFGRTPFPRIGELPYLLTMGPHSFYWFSLEDQRKLDSTGVVEEERELPLLQVRGAENILGGKGSSLLARVLPGYLRRSRWFAGKARSIKSASIVEQEPLSANGHGREVVLALVRVEYRDGESETYLLPLALATGELCQEILSRARNSVLAELRIISAGHGRGRKGDEQKGLIYDALMDPGFCTDLLGLFVRRKGGKPRPGNIKAFPAQAFRGLLEAAGDTLAPRVVGVEQSNTSVFYGESFVLKIFRRLEEGVSPDLEMMRLLSERKKFSHVPPLGGWIEYQPSKRRPVTLALLQGFVPNQGDAWRYTREELKRYYEQAMTRVEDAPEPPAATVLELAAAEMPTEIQRQIGAYLAAAQLLGQRTGELHLVLASDSSDPAFAPERYTSLYQRSSYQSMRNQAGKVLRLLRDRLATLDEGTRKLARELLNNEQLVVERFDRFLRRKLSLSRIRIHGDFHLGQVLYTGKDFVIIDFEGEPSRSLSERKRKRICLRDIAGMLRSFEYASYSVIFQSIEQGVLGDRALTDLAPWRASWLSWCSASYLRGYLTKVQGSPILPREPEDLTVLLESHLLDKAIYELGYELNSRPTWVLIPLRGILRLLGLDEA